MDKIRRTDRCSFIRSMRTGKLYEPIEAYAETSCEKRTERRVHQWFFGEGYMLTEEERMKLAEKWMEAAPKALR